MTHSSNDGSMPPSTAAAMSPVLRELPSLRFTVTAIADAAAAVAAPTVAVTVRAGTAAV